MNTLGYNFPGQLPGSGYPVPPPYPMGYGGMGYGGMPYGYGGGMPYGGGSVLPGIFGNIGGVPPTYPGPPGLQADPAYQYGPRFDGEYAHGLTQDPDINASLEDVNAMGSQINMGAGVGYPPLLA